MNDADLAFASIEEVGELFRKRKLSPVELTQLILAASSSSIPSLTLTLPSLRSSPSLRQKKPNASSSHRAAAEATATAGLYTASPFL